MEGLRFSANVAFLWSEVHDPFERLSEAAHAGFTRVERTFVHDLDTASLRAALDRNGLELTLFDPFPGDWEHGERGLLALPGREDDCRISIHEALAAAGMLGTHLLNVLGGVLSDDGSRRAALATAAENLRVCAPAAQAAGVTLLVEAINWTDMPGYAFPTIATVRELVERVDHPAVGIQFDTYHVAMMGGAILSEAERSRDHIRYVQVADVPGRHEPGTGTLPLPEFFEFLGTFYEGVIGLEYLPQRSTDDGLAWLPRPLRG
jgi:hydroxypyruvate isomerase